ncbi:dihydroorotase [Candidatus Woesearchaeota archaeon]|nr:dihydroorotase [Candidatus Woesearchaeota archaeon]|tara:strand:- start:1677 stop:2897 length:1221 start_codon:yes stop_codon:yes gene_type:complete
MSLLIKNGKIYQNNILVRKNIFIKLNKITKITSQELKADKVIDAKNNIIIPGLIDPHVHFREPGLTNKEDFLTGSMAAAAGGITTFLDMPNTSPPTINLQLLEEKRRLAKKSIVDYGFHFGSTKDNIAEIKKAKDVASVKVYMDFTTGDMKLEEYAALKKIFSCNKTVTVHAENDNVPKAIELIQNSNNDLYLAHISSRRDLHNCRKEKIKNDVFVEVAPHHLFLTKKDIDELGSYAEMKPSLKSKKDQDALWEGIKNGKVDTIATDHAPHTKEEKLDPNYPFGVPGCETMLPLLLNSLNEKRIELKKIIQLCCENPVKIFKIKDKGFIKEGFYADLTIIDLNLEKEVKNQELFTKCRWSPFDGWKLKGWPVTTIVNGNIIFENGKINNIAAKEVQYNGNIQKRIY